MIHHVPHYRGKMLSDSEYTRRRKQNPPSMVVEIQVIRPVPEYKLSLFVSLNRINVCYPLHLNRNNKNSKIIIPISIGYS